LKLELGSKLNSYLTQFHYKDDLLHDPMLDNNYMKYIMKKKTRGDIYGIMMDINRLVFIYLEEAFLKYNIQLIDMKCEYGLIDNDVHLIDEISAGSLRLWPIVDGKPDPEGRFDKDIYRMGNNLDRVRDKFEEIASITSKFKDLHRIEEEKSSGIKEFLK